jgi:formylmethanofuran dehydrogenase subunit E
MMRSPIRRYTLDIVLERAKEVHGDKFDYSGISRDYKITARGTIPVRCKRCDWKFDPTVDNHLNKGTGCPDCAGNIPWTLEKFKLRGKEVHGDRFDYSQVTDQHIKNAFSHVPVKCTICEYDFMTTIDNHINGRKGCADCAGVVQWNYDRFIEKMRKTYGDRYDYSQVTREDIVNQHSRPPVRCTICEYKWKPSIQSHLNHGCPDCAGVAPYTLERVLVKAKEVHGDKYDYSEVTEQDIKNHKSGIPVRCTDCDYKWRPNINNHINGRKGCPSCAKVLPWNLDRFLRKTKEIHEDKYDYSEITEDHIKTAHSRVPTKCKTCDLKWSPAINDHINRKTGCPHCCFTRGHSRAAIDWLKSIEQEEDIVIQSAISPNGEFKIRSPTGRYYKADGYHAATNTVYEYYGDYWHGNPTVFGLDDFNQRTKKTFGEMYKKTIERENYIKSLGYNLVVVWETPFDVSEISLSFNEATEKLDEDDFLFFKFLPKYQVTQHDSENYVASFYGRDGNIYLTQVQYDQETNLISPPV